MQFSSIKNIHLVGIGGIGMSGIAEILMSQGFNVTGSDLNQSDTTEFLVERGATITIGHDAGLVHAAEVVVYSSAVDPNSNPETVEAQQRNIPIIRRAEMLSELSRLNYCVAIAGTHGKTTTTSMTGLVMMHAGLDPTVIVGGRLKGLGGSNARLGKGDWIVLEADEYDRSFLQLLPTVAVITNVEADHLDIYDGLDDIKASFIQFGNKVPFYGTVCVCLDDPGVRSIIPQISKVVVSFGLSPQCDIRAVDCAYEERSSSFTLVHNGIELGRITISVPGEHNIKNALAACSVGIVCGVSFTHLQESLAGFTGVYRRFELKGEHNGVMVVDDYAHHPTELRATLQAARNGWQRRIIAVFQPHTYTRTRDFYEEFATSFDDADVLILMDVYPAREAPIEGISGQLIADAARAAGHRDVRYVENKNNVAKTLKGILEPGDMVLTLGAGDVWKIGLELLG